MTDNYVTEETRTLAKSLRQTLFGMGFSVHGIASFQSESGEKDAPKTRITLTLDSLLDPSNLSGEHVWPKPSVFSRHIEQTLQSYGISVNISKARHGLAVQFDTSQPDFVENLTRMQDANKDAIITYAEQASQKIYSGLRMANFTPIRPDGSALDKKYSARKLLEDIQAAQSTAESQGVTKILDALRNASEGKGGGRGRA